MGWDSETIRLPALESMVRRHGDAVCIDAIVRHRMFLTTNWTELRQEVVLSCT